MGSVGAETAASTIQRIAETFASRFIRENCTGVYSAEGRAPQFVPSIEFLDVIRRCHDVSPMSRTGEMGLYWGRFRSQKEIRGKRRSAVKKSRVSSLVLCLGLALLIGLRIVPS